MGCSRDGGPGDGSNGDASVGIGVFPDGKSAQTNYLVVPNTNERRRLVPVLTF